MNKKTPREGYFQNTFGKKSVEKSHKAEDRDQRAKTERKEQRDAERGFGANSDRPRRDGAGKDTRFNSGKPAPRKRSEGGKSEGRFNDERPQRRDKPAFGDKAPRGEGRPRKDWDDNKAPRSFKDRAEGDRPQRRDKPAFGDKAPRGEGRPRKDWDDNKAPRSFKDRAEGDRPERRDKPAFGDKAPRGEGRPRKDWGDDNKAPRSFKDRAEGDRAPRGEGRPRKDWDDRKPARNSKDNSDSPRFPKRDKPAFGDKPRAPRADSDDRDFPVEDNRVDYVKVGGKKPAAKYQDDDEDDEDDFDEMTSATPEQMPLNKYIAHCGVCSRRDAAEMIKQGKVKVNGELVTEPGLKITDSDLVTVAGKKMLRQRHFAYILLNKPKGFLTTTEDDRGRDTVMQLVASAEIDRLYPVGRLDRNTTGLLIMTNDGELAQKLSHPKYQVKKVYQVTLDKPLTKLDFDKVLAGVELEDGIAPVDALSYLDEKHELGIEIHSGRNRIVRRIFESLGYEVEKLDRVMYAGLTKKNLPRGKWRFLTEREVILLKHFKV